MKQKIITLLGVLAIAGNLYAQSSVGLVAHWDMNGSAADVTGNGHNGHVNNVTLTTGVNGVPNTAYYFNGTNSVITAPYVSDINVTQYSICAIVKANGFYSGTCQANNIIARQDGAVSGNWGLTFDDNAFNTCSVLDTTKEVFIAKAGTNAPSLASDWQYTPTIIENNWYKVVVTYSSPTWKIYVNGTLVNTATGAGTAIGTSMDSIAMGKNIWNATYPYQFKGVIDDIRFYNRVLDDTEIVQYSDTCGHIAVEPTPVSTTVGSTVTYSITTTISNPVYQWQQDAGSGFTNLTSTAPFSGVTTNILTITGVTSSMNARHYRCLVSNALSCMDTSVSVLLTVPVAVNNMVLFDAEVLVFPNPVGKSVTVMLPVSISKAQIDIFDGVGMVVAEGNIAMGSANIDLAGLAAGVYFARITFDGQVVYKRIIKQ